MPSRTRIQKHNAKSKKKNQRFPFLKIEHTLWTSFQTVTDGVFEYLSQPADKVN